MFHLRKSGKLYPFISVWLACLLAFSSSLPAPFLRQFLTQSAFAEATYSAQDLDGLMKKLLDDNITEVNKQRIAAILFYHTDTYRSAVMGGQLSADSPQVQAFLKYKEKLLSRKAYHKEFSACRCILFCVMKKLSKSVMQ